MTALYSLNDPAERSQGMGAARAAIGSSGLVVMPTDTVYGIACDAFDPVGIRRLLRAKGRGRNMPVPVLISSVDTMRALGANIAPAAHQLAREFWPGGLTIITRQQPSLQWDIGDTRGTVALRVPNHHDAISLLSATGPLGVSSANTTGNPPAVTVGDAEAMLGDSVEVYLDGGPTPGLIPSTIVDATRPELRVVRLGVITLAQLREIVPDIVVPDDVVDEPDDVVEAGEPVDEQPPADAGVIDSDCDDQEPDDSGEQADPAVSTADDDGAVRG